MKVIYVTFPNEDEALAIGHHLVEQGLVGCVNILRPVTSLFRWQDQVHTASETVLIAKTVPERVAEAMELIRLKHSYDCPCIAAWNADHVDPTFQKWLAETCDRATTKET